MLSGQPRRETVEHLAQVVELRRLFQRENRHADATTGKQLDEAFVLEPTERLANRRPADGELIGKIGLPQSRPGGEATIEDGVAQGLGGVVDQTTTAKRSNARASRHGDLDSVSRIQPPSSPTGGRCREYMICPLPRANDLT